MPRDVHGPVTRDAVLDALRQVVGSELGTDIVTLGMVAELTISPDQEVQVVIAYPPSAGPLRTRLEQEARRAILRVPGVRACGVTLRSAVGPVGPAASSPRPRSAARCVLAVASGKGGVGKSTVSVNLALALRQAGARVGVLDADVYGPNIPHMLGLPPDQVPQVADDHTVLPIEHVGLKVMSMAFFLKPGEAAVWRGPMLHKALTQFLQEVRWGELDYLVIDLPPGTGDVQLTIAQTAALTGALLVTTPQQVALQDVRRAAAMCAKVRVPILGIVENMSGFLCPHCGQATPIFQTGGGERLSQELQTEVLARLPLDPALCEGGDRGELLGLRVPPPPLWDHFRRLAERVAARVVEVGATGAALEIGVESS